MHQPTRKDAWVIMYSRVHSRCQKTPDIFKCSAYRKGMVDIHLVGTTHCETTTDKQTNQIWSFVLPDHKRRFDRIRARVVVSRHCCVHQESGIIERPADFQKSLIRFSVRKKHVETATTEKIRQIPYRILLRAHRSSPIALGHKLNLSAIMPTCASRSRPVRKRRKYDGRDVLPARELD